MVEISRFTLARTLFGCSVIAAALRYVPCGRICTQRNLTENNKGHRRTAMMATEEAMEGASDRRKTIKWCTYNIQHHGGGRLQLALKAMGVMGLDFGFFTETKISNDNYAQSVGDYKVFGSQASNNQGGVALFWKEDPSRYAVESVQGHGPNIVSFQLVTGDKRWKVVGIYCPPSETDGATLRHLEEALANAGDIPIILGGDINVDLLNSGRSVRDTEIATALAFYGLDDMSRHFWQRTKHRRRWTWKQRREGQVIRS